MRNSLCDLCVHSRAGAATATSSWMTEGIALFSRSCARSHTHTHTKTVSYERCGGMPPHEPGYKGFIVPLTHHIWPLTNQQKQSYMRQSRREGDTQKKFPYKVQLDTPSLHIPEDICFHLITAPRTRRSLGKKREVKKKKAPQKQTPYFD